MIDNILINLNKHAYLLSVDDYFSIDNIYNIVKSCANSDLTNSNREIICKLIDNKTFPDLKIIVPDGKTIKKEQIKNLISDFENKSLYNWKKIYVIEYAENLNQSSANSLLKFLEEPEEDIVAILLTKDITSVISTIVSRCEIVNLNHYNIKNFDEELVKNVISFTLRIEKNKDKAISYENELYLYKSDELKDFFEVLFFIYYDIINYHFYGKNCIFPQFKSEIKKLDELTELCDIIRKSKKIAEIKRLFDLNVNPRVCLDIFFVGDINEV